MKALAGGAVRAVQFDRYPAAAYVGGRIVGEGGSNRVGASLALLDGFELRLNGRFVPVPVNVQRLLAFLAIRRRPQTRVAVAGALWLDTAEENAARNLRSTLWRTRKVSEDLVSSDGVYVAVGADVRIDLADVADRAALVLDGADGAQFGEADDDLAGGDLLPDWSDDWVLIERERVRQLRMHALEAMCVRLTEVGRFGHAVQAGLAAVAIEPLRESARRVLIEAYLAEGNVSEAVRHLDGFRAVLDDALGIAPSPALIALLPTPR